MTVQQIIEALLRSRLYRTGVSVEMESGEVHAGFVEDLRYDGSRSLVVLSSDPTRSRDPVELRLAEVATVSSPPAPSRSGVA